MERDGAVVRLTLDRPERRDARSRSLLEGVGGFKGVGTI